MKTIKIMVAVLTLSVTYQFAAAQGNCTGNKVKMTKGSKGHGCHCINKCVLSSEVPSYQAMGWYIGPCPSFCLNGWKTEDVLNASLETSLTDIYPNPISSSATIFFSLAQAQKVSFKLFDMTGRLVAALAEEIFEGGDNEFIWNTSGTNAGVYILRIETESYSETKKVSIIK